MTRLLTGAQLSGQQVISFTEPAVTSHLMRQINPGRQDRRKEVLRIQDVGLILLGTLWL